MNTQGMLKVARAERDRWGALAEAVDFVAEHAASKIEVGRFMTAKKRLQEEVTDLNKEIGSLNSKKGAITRDLARRVAEADADFANSLSARRVVRDGESARDDTVLVARKKAHDERMAEFEQIERRASGLAKKAEDWLEKMRAKLAA